MRLIVRLALLLALSGAIIALYWYVTLPDVAALARTNPSTTAFIESRKSEAAARGRSFRLQWTWVPLAHMSSHLTRAVLAAEDAAFYRHKGFDWDGLREAVMRNWEKGQLRRGGSTITQQLAKNLYLSPEKNLFRKGHEAMLAWELERTLSKKRILELYLNVAEWGHGVYGAEAAARHHFGKSAEDLSPDEAALLAAILPSPRRYDPIRLTPYLTKRQQEILQLMGGG
ncbi:MAG: monofunctional biosynthetic peptidoglycan transglycosylase [Nitrospiraceae bacterium]|nr:MAG: monofunctional biosynthetic peptidoglycan transglycosylase [Nitrospiraceae bacterium]